MANKPIIHLYGESGFYSYGTVCGLRFSNAILDTIVKKRVTCKRCKATKRFKKYGK